MTPDELNADLVIGSREDVAAAVEILKEEDRDGLRSFVTHAAAAVDAADLIPGDWSVKAEEPVVEVPAEEIVPVEEIPSGDEAEGVVMEAVEPTGSVVDVLLIQPGMSKNRRRYSESTLRDAVPLFEGARAFAGKGVDHSPDERGVRSLVGWYTNARWVDKAPHPTKKGATVSGVAANFHVSDAAPWLKAMMADSIKRGKPDLVGFSIVGDGETALVREARSQFIDVTKINTIESVDVVVNPAAGGMPMRLVASANSLPTGIDWGIINRGEALSLIAEGVLLPEELMEKRADLYEQLLAEAVIALQAQKENGTVENQTETTVVDTVTEKVGAVITKALVEARLAGVTLPDSAKKRVREATEGKVLDETAIDAVVKAEADYIAELTKPAVTDAAAVVTDVVAPADKVKEAVYQIVAGKSSQSIKGLYVDLSNDRSFTGKIQEGAVLAEALSVSSFDQILGDSITRRMLEYYNQPGLDQWRKLVSVGSVNDMRTQRRIRFGGYNNLSVVTEGSAYGALTSPTDEEATYAPSKKGGTEVITMEMIVNDDLGAIRDIPRRLGRAAAQTLHEFVFDILKDNGAIYDSVALFHASHGNLGSTALTAASLKAARLQMLKQADVSNSKRLGITPKYLVIPVDLEQDAFTILNSVFLPSGVGTAAPSDANYARTFGLEPVSVPYWTDTNNWFLVASPMDVPTIEVGFLNGKEDPELFVQDQPVNGSMFSNDKITYKVRHIYGGAVLDYRGLQGNIVA
jgi:hypothetical protein